MPAFTISSEVVARVMARRGRVHFYERLQPSRSALLIIDMQNAFCKPGAPVEVPASREIVADINRLAAKLRARGATVIWIRSEFRQSDGRSDWENFFSTIVAEQVRERTLAYMAPGAEGSTLWHELDAHPPDLHLVKNRYSALAPGACELHTALRSRKIDTLLIGGTKTNVCCEATARAAFDMELKPVLVSDCCAALSAREHRAALENAIQQFADVMSGDEVLARMPADG